MTHRLKNVCEADGECGEDAVVTVSVWRQSPRHPVAVLRLCQKHAQQWIDTVLTSTEWDIRIDQGTQQELPLG